MSALTRHPALAIWSTPARQRFAPALVVAAGAIAIATQALVVPRGLLLPSLALFLLAGLLGLAAMRARPFVPSDGVPRPVEALGLALVVAVAIFFRIAQLTTAPEGVWFDEAMNGLVAQRILDDPAYRPVFIPDPVFLPALYNYWQVAAVALLGPNILALRLVSTLIGIATVVGLYFLARLLFGVPVALVAGLLLASQRYHVNWSRIAMNPILAPALAVGVFFFAVRGLRTGSRMDLALAGIFVGLGMYTYASFYVVPLILGVVVVAAALWSVAPRSFFAIRWRGLVLLVAAALVVMLPLLGFIVREPGVFTQRMGITSIFRDGKPPEQARADIIENVRRHALMLHYRGDNNGRHNLPGAPMLDPISAALLVLGLVYSLRHIRRPEHALLVSWLLLSLPPAILSLEFEAPQTLRSSMLMPVLALAAALPAGWLASRAWENRRRLSGFVAAVPVAVALALAGASNYDAFFNKQLVDYASWAAFSTAPTLAAREIRQLPAGARVIVSQVFLGQPTLRFLAPDLRDAEAFDPTKHLPVRGQRPVAFFLDPEADRAVDQIRAYYPTARVTEHAGPTGGASVMTAILVDPEQARAVQGLRASYFPGAAADLTAAPALARREDRVEVDWSGAAPLPLHLPFTALWDGVLSPPTYGKHRFRLEGPPDSVLLIDGAEITRGGQDGAETTLAVGNHSLRVQASVVAPGSVRLLWQTPDIRAWQTVGQDYLFVDPVASTGLLGNFYANKTWSGAPTLGRIDPRLSFRFHLLPVPRPWTAEWTGTIMIPATGTYRFATQSIDYSWLSLDERLIVDNSKGHDQLVEGAITLSAGPHDIRVRFIDQTNFTHLEVYWTPPGQPREIIPPEALRPPQGGSPLAPAPRAVPAAAASPAGASTALPARRIPDPTLTALVGAAGSGPAQLRDPRAVAVDARGRLLVADTENRRVQVFDAGGALAQTIGPGVGDAHLAEPVAVIPQAGDTLLVLDSQGGWIHRYDAQGRLLDRFGGPAHGYFQPRGMAADGAGNLFIADTGRARVVRLDAQGQVTGQVGQPGSGEGQIGEPTDVAVDGRGTLFVADVANGKILTFDANGTFLREWPTPKTVSVRGAHLAPDGQGGVYATEPGAGLIMHYGANGELLAEIGPLAVDGAAASQIVGISLARPGVLVVADSANNRILEVRLPE